MSGADQKPRRRKFRRRDARALYGGHRGPNMTPMVDVTMVILIFFMANTAFLAPELLFNPAIARRAEGSADTPNLSLEAPTFVIRLRVEGAAAVFDGLGLDGGDAAQLAAAARALAAEIGTDSGSLFVIEPGDEAPYEAVIAAQEALTAAGLRRIAIR